MAQRTVPSLNALKEQFNPMKREIDAIESALYDHILYPGAGSTQLNLFALPIGQGVTTALGATVGAAKTISDTNMTMAGSVPAGSGFLVEQIEAAFYPGLSAAANTFTYAQSSLFNAAAAAAVAAQVSDIQTFYMAGSLKFTIGQKTFTEEGPLMNFPPSTRFENSSAVASNSATVGEVAIVNARAGGRPYHITPQSLMPNVAFGVQLNYQGGVVAMPSGFNGRVGIRLKGILYRNVQ